MKRWAIILAWILVPTLLLACVGIPVPFVLVFGWLIFLWETLPEMSVEPAALWIAGGALVLLTALAHYLARWLWSQRAAAADAPPRGWRFRWTVQSVGLVLVLFVAAIAMVATVHETWWLIGTGQPISTSGMERPRAMMSRNNLKQIGLAAYNYHTEHGKLPSGGTCNERSEMLHSWATALMPYMEYGPPPEPKLPWNHPRNAAYFKRVITPLINPSLDAPVEDAEGYGLSHYAANSRVLGRNTALRFADVKDGTAHTILAGEVNTGFQPWGHPVNWRDPAAGIGNAPDRFGGKGRSVHFVMVDGSVRTIGDDIDPTVLKALATPDGGEPPPDPKP